MKNPINLQLTTRRLWRLQLTTNGLRWLLVVANVVSVLLVVSFPAGAAPLITNVELTSLSDNSMVVTWSTTLEDSSTEILWGSSGLTNIATGSASSSIAVMSGTTKFHYVELKGLYQNTTYQYRVKSGATLYPPPPFDPSSFTTLARPSGEYLFSFAVLNDLRYAEGKASSTSGRGIPFFYCPQIIASEESDIDSYRGPSDDKPAFIVLNGNLVDSWGTDAQDRGDQAKTELLNKFATFTGASDLGESSYRLNPTPGYYDKNDDTDPKTYYTSDWITDNMNPISNNRKGKIVGATEEGYVAGDANTPSIFNYHFSYKHYNFIFLDSLKNDGKGSVNLDTLYKYLSAESNSKTFVFMSFPGYDPMDSNTKDYPIAIPTSEVGGGTLTIDNAAAFRATLESFKDTSGNPIVAAVVSGHLGDNYKREIPTTNGISYVRQGPALQYPTGYSIYKVYSTGYIKTFYKTKGRDETDKPYYEYARDQISTEVVSGTTLLKEVLTQFWLGSSSSRNFTYTYAFIPGVAPKILSTSPASNETSVTLNSPILLTFNKRMSESILSTVNDWCSISPSPGTLTASFLDSSRTIVKITHSDFTVDKTYTITLTASKIIDEGSTPMDSNYTFSFDTTGGTKDELPPSAYIYPLPDNSTTDPFPNFTGIATDESKVITVTYCFDNSGNWASTEAVDGKFTGSVEVFQIKSTSPLSTGTHEVWLKTSDGAGNTSATGFRAYGFTILAGDKPTTSVLKFNGGTIYPGDPISTTPKIEIVFTSLNTINSARITIGSITKNLTPLLVKVDTNYYATYEVENALALADGTYSITIEAFDILGNGMTYEVSSLYVQSAADVTVQGVPLNYPNPFDPGDPNNPTTKISYTLSKPSNITLSIHDLSGNTIARKTFSSVEEGGRAPYNEVPWDGRSDTGQVVGNGIYIYLIIADGKVVSRGKITVLKR